MPQMTGETYKMLISIYKAGQYFAYLILFSIWIILLSCTPLPPCSGKFWKRFKVLAFEH